jgi:hypothetical protein
MNVGGGEAADQMVRMMLSGTEVAVRLSGSAMKNLLALTLALAKDHKQISGKINLGKMLRETRDLRRFPMTPQQYKQFQRLAKKNKLLYSVIRDKDDRGRVLDVILPVTELARANDIFERILYTLPPEPEREPRQGREVFQRSRQNPEQAQEKAVSEPVKGRQGQEQPQPEVSQQPAGQSRQKAPVSGHQEDTPKKDSRSERDSPGIKISSSSCRESGASRTTSERPSVEARLKAFQTQLRKPSAPAKVKAKTRPKQR